MSGTALCSTWLEQPRGLGMETNIVTKIYRMPITWDDDDEEEDEFDDCCLTMKMMTTISMSQNNENNNIIIIIKPTASHSASLG